MPAGVVRRIRAADSAAARSGSSVMARTKSGSLSRRQNILRRAAEVFAEKGVASTSLEDIANAVGIKREGIYYYFKNRGNILLEIILPQSKMLLSNQKRVVASNVTSMQKLHDAIEVHLDAFNPSYLEMSVALREDYLRFDDLKLAELKVVWDEYNEVWIELVEQGQADGTFKPDLNAKMVAYGLLGMCNWVSRWYDPDGDVSISEIIRTYFSIASSGLAVEGHPILLRDPKD